MATSAPATSMTPVDWAKRPLQKYADFTGRAPRAEFWWFVLLVVIGEVVAMILDSILGIHLVGAYGPVLTLFFLAILAPYLAVGARRLHDTNRSGWWLLIGLIPLIGAIVLLVFFLLPGDSGSNDFGSNPYGA